MLSSFEKNKLLFMGKEFETNAYGMCRVVEYKRASEVFVEFEHPVCIVKTSLGSLKKGAVANPMKPSVYGKGFMGVGKYSSLNKREYGLWSSMLRRVLHHRNDSSYKDVSIQQDWYDFQIFAEWCNNNVFLNSKDEKGEKYQLDKDILGRHSRSYSSETCCFVPQEINTLVLSNKYRRGSNPIGVVYCKRDNKYIATIRDGSTTRVPKNLGYFDNPIGAFNAYKEAKEDHIKVVANKWKGRIDEKVYQALMNWEVSLDD